MINKEIIEQIVKDDATRVTVKLSTEEIFSIEGVVFSTPERQEAYHQGLHTDRVNHNHNRKQITTTVWVEHPYTDEKLDLLLEPFIQDLNSTAPVDFHKELNHVQERCLVNGSNEKQFYVMEYCPEEVKQALLNSFPEYDLDTIALISSPSNHEVLGEMVISAFLKENDVDCLSHQGTPLVAKARKFCLTSNKYYDRCYGFCTDDFSFIPDSCEIMAKSFHINVQEGLTLPDFYDVYFSGNDSEVQSAFNLPNIVGNESTYYGVTVVNGAVVRAKQYCYDRVGIFSDWDDAMARRRAEHNIE